MSTPAYTTATACRCCGSDRITPLFSLGEQYVNDFVAQDVVKSGYRDCPRCPIDLDLCEACGLIQARHVVDMNLLYRGNYWYRSGTTSTMRDALKDVVRSAMRVCPLSTGDVVLDIGSNDGTLLRCYPPEMVRVGVEPANNLATPENYVGLELVHDFWPYTTGKLHDSFRPKIVTACGMFYDLVDPNPFIADVAKVLHPEGVFIAQLMCLKQTLAQQDVGNFCHEHLEYYTLASLHEMLKRHGLGIFDVEENEVNGGSYRLYCCHRGSKVQQTDAAKERCVQAFTAEVRERLHDAGHIVQCYHKMLQQAQDLKALLLREKSRGRRIFAMGASTKGNTILQFAGIDATIVEGVADKNPDKFGRYTVGTGIPIISLEAMRQFVPEVVLVLPYAFRDEFIELEKDQTWRKRGGKFVFPLPKLEIA